MNKKLRVIVTILSTGVIVIGGITALWYKKNTKSQLGNQIMLTSQHDEENEKLNGWKQENGDWYFYKDNEIQTNWLEYNGKRYFLGDNGKKRLGWIKDDSDTWFYMYEDGMATNTIVDGCYLGPDGTIQNAPAEKSKMNNNNSNINMSPNDNAEVTSTEEAEQIILKNDFLYIKKIAGSDYKLRYYALEQDDSNWYPSGTYYKFSLRDKAEEAGYCGYYVNKYTGQLYIIPHQGECNVYEIKNNKIVNKFKHPRSNSSINSDWR